MGVNIYVLDRRPVRLSVAGVEHLVGSLRRSWKVTEVDDQRAAELEASESAAPKNPTPVAAMVAEVAEMRMVSTPGALTKAHLVLGWDIDRTSVTDMGWDYLPVLGYGVRDPATGVHVLYEVIAGALHPLTHRRGATLGLIASDGHLVRLGQPTISSCEMVRPYIPGFAEADCVFSDGRHEKLLVGVVEGQLPDASWLIGKRPLDVERYPPPEHT